MSFTVYLSGEIHTDWRDEIQRGAEAAGLDIVFTAPVTDHPASDAAGDHLGGDLQPVLARPPVIQDQRHPYPHPDREERLRGGALRRQVQAVERGLRRRVLRRAGQALGDLAR